MGFRDEIEAARRKKNENSAGQPTSFRQQIYNERAEKAAEPPKPKTVTMRVGGEKMEVPQAFALAVKQTVKQNQQPFVGMENNDNTYFQKKTLANPWGKLGALDFNLEKELSGRGEIDSNGVTKDEYLKLLQGTQGVTPAERQEIIDKVFPIKSNAQRYRPENQYTLDALNKAGKLYELIADDIDSETAAWANAASEKSDPLNIKSHEEIDDIARTRIRTLKEINKEKHKEQLGFEITPEMYQLAQHLYADRYKKYKADEQAQIEANKAPWWEVVGNTLNTGLAMFNEGVAKGVEWIVPSDAIALWTTGSAENDPLKSVTNLYESERERADAKRIQSLEGYSDFVKGMSDLGVIVENSFLSSLPAILSGGATAGMTAGGTLAGASGTSSTLAALQTVVKNPQTWSTFAMSGGAAYDKAKKEGASETDAQMYAISVGAFDAITEQGGFEGLVSGKFDDIANPVAKLLKPSAEEAAEEVAQGLFSRGAEKMTYNPQKELLSTTNSEAVFNPNTILEEAGAGFASALVGGSVTSATNLATNAATNAYERAGEGRALGKEFREGNMTAEDMQSIISEGLATNPDSSSYKLAAKLQQKLDAGQPVSWTEYGKLYNENVRNVDSGFETEESAAKPTVNVDADDEERKITPGFVRNEYSYDMSNKTIRALDAIGKKLGVEIEIGAPTGNSVEAYNGKYENGKITIARDAENPLEVVLSHEVTHHMQKVAPTEYAKFVELAVNASTKLSGDDKSALIEKYRTAYSEGTRTEFSDQAAIDEITADYAGKLVRDVSLFRGLLNADRNVAQRFVDGVKRFISSVKSTFSKDKKKADTASLEKYGATVSELEAAVKAYEGMIKDTRAAVESGEVGADVTSGDAEIFGSVEAETENTVGTDADGERKYDLKKDARRNVDKAVSQKGYNGEIELTTGSPSIITSQKGTKNYPLVMKASHIRENILTEKEAKTMGLKVNKNIHYHGLGKEKFLNIIEDLDNVTEAYRGTRNADKPERRENYFLLISKYTDGVGNVINVPIYIDEKAQVNNVFIDVNKVATVFGREGLRVHIKEQIAKGNLVRIKNRSINASEGSSLINDHYSKDASTDSIPETTEKSNSQFSLKKNVDSAGRELSAEQTEYFADSKVRDSEGNLLVLYHQTGEDFSVFDVRRKGAGTSDGHTPFGIFLKTTESDIGLRGKKQMQLYADIKNPLYAMDREDLIWKIKKMSSEFARLEEKRKSESRRYEGETDAIGKEIQAYLVEWREANPNASRVAVYDDPKYNELSDREDFLIEEWGRVLDEISLAQKIEITETLKNAGYDGVILKTDEGSFGRKTDAYIALSSEQVKSVNNKTPTGNPDINLSLKTGDLLSKDYKPRERAKAEVPPEVPSEVVVSKTESAAPKTVTETRAVTSKTPRVAEAPEESGSYLEETGLVEAETPSERAEVRDEKLDDYMKRLEKHSRVIAEPQEIDEDDDPGAVYRSYVSNPATEKKTLGEKVKETTSFAKRKFTNSGDAIRQIAKETKDDTLYPAYNQARSSTNVVANMVSNKQTNIRGEKVGESLENILRPIKAKGKTYFNDFHLYLLHKHNIARMSIYNAEAEEAATNALLAFNREFPAFSAMSEDELNRNAKWDDEKGYRAREYIELRRDLRKAREQNKPVFYSENGNPITAKTSERTVNRFIKKYPEFKDYEKNVRTYLDNLMQYRIDSGLVTEDEAEYFKKKYPDYVPTYRATEKVMQQISGRKDISKTLGRAKGGKIPFIPLDIALAEMTKKVVRNGQKNVFANKLYKDYEKSGALGKYMLDVAEMERDIDNDIDAFGDEEPITDNTVSFYRNGSRIEFVATPDLYEAFETLSPQLQEKNVANSNG